MRFSRGRRSLPCLVLALLMAFMIANTGGPALAEDEETVLDTFLPGYNHREMEFRDSTWTMERARPPALRPSR